MMTAYIRNRFFEILLLFIMVSAPTLAGCSSDDRPDPLPPPADEIGNEWVIYEVNPGLFEHQNAFNAIADRLDEIAELGVNIIWLMPIYEQGVLDAFGSPYCVKDYKKVNANYGTLEELKSLVTKARSKNMKVILDWVANHTSWDNSWIQNKEWYTQDGNGNIVSPPGMNWADVADLNYSNMEMRKAMLDAMKYWVTEAGIDGYRCDYAEGVPGDFWEEAIKELKVLKKEDLVMLAEGGNADLFSYGFNIVYGWDFAYKLQDLYAGKTTLSSLYNTHHQEYQRVEEGKQRMRYITNHDMAFEKSPIQAYNGEKGALSAFVIAVTMGGSPMIYSSQEIGYAHPLTFFEQRQLDWNSNSAYTSEYKKIMSVYTSSDALKKGALRTFDTDNVASFHRASQDEGILIMVNTTDQTKEVKIPIEFAHEDALNLMDNTSETLPSVVTMEPYQYNIWKVE